MIRLGLGRTYATAATRASISRSLPTCAKVSPSRRPDPTPRALVRRLVNRT